MQLHPLAEQFGSVADAYERGRPEYAPAVVGAFAAELRIGPGHPVLDLAAGTGKLTRALVAFGFDTVAVEPQGPLRDKLIQRIGTERVKEGVAEDIPLPDGSQRAVTVADAFHWFDRTRALAEIRRVLGPGGGLVVINTVPDWSGASWAHELGELVLSMRPEHPNFDGPPWQEAIRAAEGWGEPREIRVSTPLPADTERIVDHMASMSWIAALPDAERQPTLVRIRALLEAGDTPEELPMHFVIGLATRD
jgi:SAM-dependent methyltransferase